MRLSRAMPALSLSKGARPYRGIWAERPGPRSDAQCRGEACLAANGDSMVSGVPRRPGSRGPDRGHRPRWPHREGRQFLSWRFGVLCRCGISRKKKRSRENPAP